MRPPSEIGGIGVGLAGMIPGVLLCVTRWCTCGVWRIFSGSVGFVEVCGICIVSSGKCYVSPLNILANASKAFVCSPGLRASSPRNFSTALSRSLATLVAASIGVLMGNSKCWR